MFIKHVSELKYSDIEDLIENRKEKEGYTLDYKEALNSNIDIAKKDLAKDVSSFANSYGGYLILGVTDNGQIVGVEKTIQNKRIDEWINQVLNTNVEPQLFYFDPNIIPIPGSEKVIVVIYIPESTKKPHYASEWHHYFIRINDRSKKANHNQIRDMFEFSRNRTDEFNDFLKRRNLFDEDSPEFGLTRNTKKIYSDYPEKIGSPKPLVIFSLIPKYPSDDKLNLEISEFKNWLYLNSSGYNPLVNQKLYTIDDNLEIKLDGIVLNNFTYSKGITSYFEILNNGYIEVGFSTTFCPILNMKHKEGVIKSIFQGGIISYELLLLDFAQKFYNYIKYYDEVLIQISFVNVLDFAICDFARGYGIQVFGIPSVNSQHNNFKLLHKFKPSTLTSDDKLSIANNHSKKISRAFGNESDSLFEEDPLKLRVSRICEFRL